MLLSLSETHFKLYWKHILKPVEDALSAIKNTKILKKSILFVNDRKLYRWCALNSKVAHLLYFKWFWTLSKTLSKLYKKLSNLFLNDYKLYRKDTLNSIIVNHIQMILKTHHKHILNSKKKKLFHLIFKWFSTLSKTYSKL